MQPLVLRVARAVVERDEGSTISGCAFWMPSVETLLPSNADLLHEMLARFHRHSSGPLRAASIVSGTDHPAQGTAYDFAADAVRPSGAPHL
jgi:hypothetical protein